MDLLWVTFLIVSYLVLYFFSVRLVIFDHLSWKHNSGKISGSTWTFALLFNFPIPYLTFFIVLAMADPKGRRKALFMPPKREKVQNAVPRSTRIAYKFREILGRLFVIGDTKPDDLLYK